ncbi:MAG TPA: hypothetical protein VN493_21795 [Thermoanaerobaculia bacterium]|nr:hypothetical protein [Thermoanaerobaculia bacterium]
MATSLSPRLRKSGLPEAWQWVMVEDFSSRGTVNAAQYKQCAPLLVRDNPAENGARDG